MLQRKLRFYARQQLLVIDEVGYLSYSNRHADLLFDIVSSRSQQRSTIVTTNRPFAEWSEACPNAACVVALVDRLVHNAEIIAIDGDSYRRKEAEEHQEKRTAERRLRRGAAGVGEPGRLTPKMARRRRRRSLSSSLDIVRPGASQGPASLFPRRRHPSMPRLPPRSRPRRSVDGPRIDRQHQRPATSNCKTAANTRTFMPSPTIGSPSAL